MALVVLLAVGCREGGQAAGEGREFTSLSGDSLSDLPNHVCDPDWRRELPDTPSVIRVTGVAEAPCTLSFREIGRLDGDMDGVAPALPITEMADGRFVTATFTPGILAVWDAEGNLLDTFGEGSGEGPGEFSSLVSLVPMGGDTVAAMTSRWVANVFSIQEGFQFAVASRQFPTLGQFEWIRSEGLVGINRHGALVRITGDSLDLREGVQDSTPRIRFVSSDGSSLWTSEDRSYRIVEVLPNGTRRHVIERHAYGFEPSSSDPEGPNLFDVIVGENRLIWVGISAPDPDAPSAPPPRRFESDEERMASDAEYHDAYFEVISPTGDLVASVRYDSWWDAPRPISSSLWYRIDDDLLRSLILLEPVFTER